MDALWVKNMLKLKHVLKQDVQSTVLYSKVPHYLKGKFSFRPDLQSSLQIARFIKHVESGQWNGNLVFKGYKGTFKTEFWILIESQLRNLENLQTIQFVDTKLQKQHLEILKNWLQWIELQDLNIILKQNELDDLDIQNFLFDTLQRNISIDQILIVSNPGIFKGDFLKNLKRFIANRYINGFAFKYELLKNKQVYSIALVKILNDSSDQERIEKLNQVKNKIAMTYYYDLNFSYCFTEKNNAAFLHLIQQCYHEDNLEQLSQLNVSQCILGDPSTFTVICKLMSMAKGLLKLSIQKQAHLKNAYQIEALMGDRYDRLRLNSLDISNNQEIVEKAFKVFAEKLLTTSCKEYETAGSLGQHLPVIIKVYYLTEAYQRKVKELEQELTKKTLKQIPKTTQKILDLSKTENYNRHDLVYNLLLSTIYTEFSALKKITVQNCDVGRMKSYISASKQFKEEMKSKMANNPLYKNFKSPLTEFNIPQQTYRMEIETQKLFFLECVFTKRGDIFEFQTITLEKCFKQTNREEGFQEAIKEMLETIKGNQKTYYTIKKISFQSTSVNLKEEQLTFLLFNHNMELEEFIMNDDEIEVLLLKISKISNDRIMEIAINFTQELKENQFYSLKTMILNDIYTLRLDVIDFLKIFIYNNKIRLETLELVKISTEMKEEKCQELETIISNWNATDRIHLKSLTFGDFDGEGHREVMRYLVLSPWGMLEKLSLIKIKITEFVFDMYKQYNQLILEKNVDPLKNLQKLELSQIDFKTPEDSKIFSSIFIFSSNMSLRYLRLHKITFNNIFLKGISVSIETLIEFLEKQQQQFQIRLNTLIYDECEISTDCLSIFLSNIVCEIRTLQIINCKALSESFLLCKQYQEDNELSQYHTYTFEEVLLQNCSLSLETFEWFFQSIVFNEKKQQMHTLGLVECELTDEQLDIIGNILQKLKQIHNRDDIKRYYRLRKIDFSKNSNLSEQGWIRFFNKIQDVLVEAKQIDENSENQDNKIILHMDQNSDYIIQQQLQLQDKIICQPSIFRYQGIQKLKILDLMMKFTQTTPEKSQFFYSAIIKGFLLCPNCNLEELTLRSLDLDMFMNEHTKISEQLELCYEKNMENYPQFNVTTVSFLQLENQSENSMQQFVKTFISKRQSKIHTLILNPNKSKLISQLLQNSSGQQQLMKLELKDCQEELSSNQIVEFFRNILFGQIYPITELTLGKLFSFQQPTLLDLKYELQFNQSFIPLQKLDLTSNDTDEVQIGTYQQIISLLLELPSTNLQTLILRSEAKINLLADVYKSEFQQFKIAELQLQQNLALDIGFLTFLQKCRSNLSKLKIKKLIVDEQIEDVQKYLMEYCARQDFVATNLEITAFEGSNIKLIFEKFIFNHEFNFNEIKLAYYKAIVDLALPTNLQALTYLNLSFGLVFNSASQISEQALTLIGQRLIYNVDSQLESLVLHQCHLKLPGIKALVNSGDEFRNKIIQEGTANKVQLKLKRLNVYYSLYLLDEGFALISDLIIYFEFISIERFELQVTNFNDDMALSLVKSAKKWLQFQQKHNRKYQNYFPLKYFDLARNEFISTELAWNGLCDTFLFSDLTPYLEVLNIHFMSMTDPVVNMIVQKCTSYFNSKPKNYVYTVKRLNYSLNTALTSNGWRQISEQFFFHPKVELEELNMNSTMLDDNLKIDAIFGAIFKKAQTKPDKKLKLHTFLCFNISLKTAVKYYMSPRPNDYKDLEDIPVFIDPNSADLGMIDGIPENFGEITQIIQKVLYDNTSFINQKNWASTDQLRFSQYHFTIVDQFLKPLNDFFKLQNKTEFNLYLNTKSLDSLALFYRYPTEKPGKPYPYNLLFQPPTFNYLRNKQCILNKIIIIPHQSPKQEEIDQLDILTIWELVKSKKTSIDQIIIDYYLNDDLIEEMFRRGYNELDIVQLVRIFPPSRIRIQNTISLQAIKGIYSILQNTHNFNYSNIQYDFNNFLNIGIGYALRELVYNKKITTFFRHGLKKSFYRFFNMFVSSVEKYEYSEQISELNTYLKDQNFYFYLIAFNNLLFYWVCVLGPVLFTKYYEGDGDVTKEIQYCENGPSDWSSYTYYIFAVFSVLIEAFVHRKISIRISKHMKKYLEIEIEQADDESQQGKQNNKIVPLQQEEEEVKLKEDKIFISNNRKELDKEQELEQKEQKQFAKEINLEIEQQLPDHEQDKQQHQFQKHEKKQTITLAMYKQMKSQVNSIGQQINNISQTPIGQFLLYMFFLFYSQLEKFDLFNDVAFIITCYYCKEMNIFYAYLVITAVSQGIQFFDFLKLVYNKMKRSQKRQKLMSTNFINDFCDISAAGKNSFLADILYQIAPFNVSVIPNNFITKLLIPDQAGKCINNQVKNYITQFIFEDMPQMILLLYFTAKQTLLRGESIQIQIYITIITSLLSLMMAFWVYDYIFYFRFMSIRPSNLSQDDFDALSSNQQKNIPQVMETIIQKEKEILETFTKLYKKESIFSENDQIDNLELLL